MSNITKLVPKIKFYDIFAIKDLIELILFHKKRIFKINILNL